MNTLTITDTWGDSAQLLEPTKNTFQNITDIVKGETEPGPQIPFHRLT